MFRSITVRFYCNVSKIVADSSLNNIAKPKKITKVKGDGHISQFFVDYKNVKIKGGKGGDGEVSFMKLYANEWAGPDGGDGGNGGHVIFRGEHNLKSLNKIKTNNIAENGENGRSFHMRGKNGEHLIIKVPLGTVIKNEFGENLVDIEKHDQNYIAAHGGSGGKGNYYYLSNINKEPRQFEYGHKGEEKELILELKISADASLIGYPNVGKSSLLNTLTRARTKVGDYAFTTLHPHVGIVEYEDYTQISISDLPGMLPDPTRGLGTGFLRHIERSKIIIFVIDLSLDDPEKQYYDMRSNLEYYDKNILNIKPFIIIGNKIDKVEAKKNLIKLKNEFNLPIIPMSTTERINITKFLIYLRSIYDKIPKNI